MTETTAIVVSIVGSGIGIIGVMGLMLRILTTNIGKQFETNATQMKDVKADLGARIDDINRRFDSPRRFRSALQTDLSRRAGTRRAPCAGTPELPRSSVPGWISSASRPA